ncbi:MAG: hypothetical protein ACREFX_10155 [Opitutaceae bacterium]
MAELLPPRLLRAYEEARNREIKAAPNVARGIHGAGEAPTARQRVKVGAFVMANEFASLGLLLRPLRKELSVELAHALIDLRADDELQRRYDLLAERNTEDILTPAERVELKSLVCANSLLGALKVEARAVLQGAGTG